MGWQVLLLLKMKIFYRKCKKKVDSGVVFDYDGIVKPHWIILNPP